jgi:hypothetical protein
MTVKANPLDIDDFELDTWLEDKQTRPEWLRAGVEAIYYQMFQDLVNERKKQIEETKEPENLGVSSYQVYTSDVTRKLRKSRSAIRPERYPRLVKYFEDTNAMLAYYWKSKVDGRATSKGYRNKPELEEENRLLKQEIEKLKTLSHRTFFEQVIAHTDNIKIQDKIGKIAMLEERNKELELQVARLSSQLRKALKPID